jgi:hypothetical protein
VSGSHCKRNTEAFIASRIKRLTPRRASRSERLKNLHIAFSKSGLALAKSANRLQKAAATTQSMLPACRGAATAQQRVAQPTLIEPCSALQSAAMP